MIHFAPLVHNVLFCLAGRKYHLRSQRPIAKVIFSASPGKKIVYATFIIKSKREIEREGGEREREREREGERERGRERERERERAELRWRWASSPRERWEYPLRRRQRVDQRNLVASEPPIAFTKDQHGSGLVIPRLRPELHRTGIPVISISEKEELKNHKVFVRKSRYLNCFWVRLVFIMWEQWK